jgi:phage FluMu gp28-like protein
MEITLIGGALLRFLGSDDPDNLYGEDVYAAVIDEGSRCREEAFHAVRSTLTATHGPLRIIGNVKGRRNWFYRGARLAEEGRENHHYARITAYDAIQAKILTTEDVEDARFVLPPAVFKELYQAEASDDQGNPFGYQAIKDCVMSEISAEEPVLWGWDLAKSVDWTVGIALDRQWQVCRFERFQKPWMDTLMQIRQLVGRTPALVDSTGVGDPLVEAMQRGGMNVEGFKFSSSSKQQIMEGLMAAIQQRKIRYPDGPIVRELESFEYTYYREGVRYAALDGLNDDCVDALALVLRLATDPRFRARMGPIVKALHAGRHSLQPRNF